MPSSRSWRMPLWLPCLLIVTAAIVIVCCSLHLRKRIKARWPW